MYVALCAACAHTCHKNHQIVSLYSKRNITCECGLKDHGSPCNYKSVAIVNEYAGQIRNAYNHNFENRFCKCKYDGHSATWSTQCFCCCDWICYDCSPLVKAYMNRQSNRQIILFCESCVKKNSYLKLVYTLSIKFTCEILNEGQRMGQGDERKKNNKNNKYNEYLSAHNVTQALKTRVMQHVDKHIYKNATNKFTDIRDTQDCKAFFVEFEFLNYLCQCNGCIKFMQQHDLEFILYCDEMPGYRYEEVKGILNHANKIDEFYSELNIDKHFESLKKEGMHILSLINANDSKTSDYVGMDSNLRLKRLNKYLLENKISPDTFGIKNYRKYYWIDKAEYEKEIDEGEG